ncbi:MAG: NAD(P)H-dependent oxidoreductase [Caulobacteraceae bacterium]
MKHAVIVGHPDPDSFNLAVARSYCDAVSASGHEPVLRDLYRMNFDPRLQAQEIPRPGGFAPAPDVEAERALIGDAQVFAFIYPLWFNAPPAIVKGYVDRVFGMGFGYGAHRLEGAQPLLAGRKMISFTSSGAPTDWLKKEGGWRALRNLFDAHVAAVCGLQVVGHVHFGGVMPGMRPDAVERNLRKVRRTVNRIFRV